MVTRQNYVQAVKNVLINESSSPSVEFILLFANRVSSLPLTEPVIDEFAPIVKQAFQQFIGDRINKSLSKGNQSNGSEKYQRESDHVVSDEEFESFFVVNVA